MNKLEWGVAPENCKMAWGARAIIKYNRYSDERDIDIPWDRQSFARDDDCRMDKDDFVYWINNSAIPHLESKVKKYDTKHIELHSDGGHFHCVAEDRSSGGYLYIGAWSDV